MYFQNIFIAFKEDPRYLESIFFVLSNPTLTCLHPPPKHSIHDTCHDCNTTYICSLDHCLASPPNFQLCKCRALARLSVSQSLPQVWCKLMLTSALLTDGEIDGCPGRSVQEMVFSWGEHIWSRTTEEEEEAC